MSEGAELAATPPRDASRDESQPPSSRDVGSPTSASPAPASPAPASPAPASASASPGPAPSDSASPPHPARASTLAWIALAFGAVALAVGLLPHIGAAALVLGFTGVVIGVHAVVRDAHRPRAIAASGAVLAVAGMLLGVVNPFVWGTILLEDERTFDVQVTVGVDWTTKRVPSVVTAQLPWTADSSSAVTTLPWTSSGSVTAPRTGGDFLGLGADYGISVDVTVDPDTSTGSTVVPDDLLYWCEIEVDGEVVVSTADLGSTHCSWGA
ncbi:hypothetical protein F8O01_13130 [Pseudoclavibacter chungangensis]|uniref:DUF4190 domain-containing protein n=1 Tax=Pseudoclavibacter chungangensis TaxID=587635 RepID=A0A7J5BRF6_9MICO|nr:hypothetical protein [Pseudoclavibacter chungangensis]KAB1654833.1 hypothetical protein F8O01_13130 [Pseudoclavibacter chungangensis]NYJ68044.1 hypothetical protein [Pseudoclavibacter chungangensis]